MSRAAQLREISARTGISIPTLMNRYHGLGLRGEALEAPVGALRRGRGKPDARTADSLGFRSPWPACASRVDDRMRNDALIKWERVDPMKALTDSEAML